MHKLNRKILTGAVVLIIFVAGMAVYMLSGGKSNDASTRPGTVAIGQSGYPADARDMAVYAALDNYISAQVKNERNAVLEMLTEEHRREWNENSFLLTENAVNYFDEIKLEKVSMGVIGYEKVGARTDAYVRVQYNVFFIKDGQVEGKAGADEQLALSDATGNWLISTSLRTVVAAQ